MALVILIPLVTAALLAFLFRSALPHLPLEEFEGLGAIACAFTYIGIFLWRVRRALTEEEKEEEEAESHRSQTLDSPQDPPANPVGHL